MAVLNLNRSQVFKSLTTLAICDPRGTTNAVLRATYRSSCYRSPWALTTPTCRNPQGTDHVCTTCDLLLHLQSILYYKILSCPFGAQKDEKARHTGKTV